MFYITLLGQQTAIKNVFKVFISIKLLTNDLSYYFSDCDKN